MAPWKLPVIVAALAAPVVAAFALGGAAAGMAMGAVIATAVIVVAARQVPRGPIGPAPSTSGVEHVLLVITCAVEEPASVRQVATTAELNGEREAEVRVLSPAKLGFLDRWASDVEGARGAAQENLVAAVAALAKAGISAEARVGDEDVVQAVEDQLQSFAADEVVLVSQGGDEAENVAAELGSRLRAHFHHVVLAGE